MKYIVILICALMSCAKVTTQGYVAKGNIKNSADSLYVNCLIFFFTSIIFSLSLKGGINSGVIVYAVLFGISSSCFQIFYALALKTGPFSATCMLVNLSMVVSVGFSVIYFDEKLTLLKILGSVMCICAMYLNTKSDGRKISLKWLFYVALAFVSTGFGISTTQKLFAKSEYANCVEQFVFVGYLVAFIFTFVLISALKMGNQKINFKPSIKNVALIFAVALFLGIYQYFKTNADSFVDAVVLNPSISGLATTFQMISGRIIFKEKFSLKKICSLCVGIAAILLISI